MRCEFAFWFICIVTIQISIFHRVALAQTPFNLKQILHGPDLPGMPVPIQQKGGDGQSCAFMCIAEPKCRGYNWLPSGCDDPGNSLECPSNETFANGCCWLKSEASSLKSASVRCGGSFIIRPDPTSIPVTPITPAPPKAKNVLYVLVDDMRPDAVPFGASFMNTPHLTHLATSPGGVYFSSAYCNIAVCSPSRMSFLTGKYPYHTLTWNFVNHIRQATCQEYPATQMADVSSAYQWVKIQNGGAGQCCSWCSDDSKCAAWQIRGGSNCTLFEKTAKTPSVAPAGSIGGVRGSTEMQRNTITCPQHFTKNGYYTLSTGKVFHTEEGGSGPAPWDGEGTGMPPLQDPPSWSQPKSNNKSPNLNSVGPGNTTMYNVNAMAPGRDCAWDKCSVNSNLQGDVEPGTFQFCDRIIGDDALLKLDAAATNYRTNGQPFFLSVGFRKPHLPFRHPSAYDDRYPAIQNIPLAKYPIMNATIPPIAYHQTPLAANPYVPMDNTKAATLRRNYYAAISWTDYNIGRLLSELDTLGLTNDTLVVFHADHGWSLGEHGQWEKFTNWEHSTRVPLIMRAPWLTTGSSSGKVSDIVELIDIFPTMAELAGITVPESYNLDGSSFAPLVRSALSGNTVNLVSDNSDIPMNTILHDYSLSVYPRCPADLSDPSRYWANNDCLMTERAHFPFMGVSLRVQGWRYTEWLKWNGTTLSPMFDSSPVGVELYSHDGDDGTSFDGPYEVYNLAGLAEYEGIQTKLAAKLREVYPTSSAWPLVANTKA